MIRKEKIKELESYINEFKTIQDKNEGLINNGFLSIEKHTCLLNNGKTIIREKIIKNKKDGSACTILPITEEGNVILVVQPRVFSALSVGIEFPAGYVEEKEEPFESAKRELEEETGYTCNDLILLAKYYQDEGCSAAFNYCYLALNCKKIGNQHLDKDEYIKYFECTFEEALELLDLGYICGVNSTLALEKAKQLLKKN